MSQNSVSQKNRGDQHHEQQPICVWYCHGCGAQGGMSTMIKHCPECGHERCESCDAEWVYAARADGFLRRAVSKSPVQAKKLDDCSQKLAVPEGLSDDALEHWSYPIKALEGESRMISLRRNPLATDVPALSPDSACTSQSSPDPSETHTPRSVSCLFINTPRSHRPPYGDRQLERAIENNGESEHDEDDSIDTEDDGEDLPLVGYSPDSMRILESRFLSLLNHESNDVPELLEKFQELMQFEFGVTTATNSSAETPSSGAGTFDPGSIQSSSITTPSQSNASSRSPNIKRSRKRDNEEQKPKRTRRSQVPERDILHFACPFRKKDPSKYGSLTDERFSSCLAPKIPELRRIKYHLESTHRTPQCVRCFSLFKDERGLMDHQREEPCSRQADSLKEGINPNEWSSIKDLLKAKKTKSEAEKLEYEKGKWFEIFKLLFPDVNLPGNPWNELYTPASTASITVDHILGSFERHVEQQIENRNLERDSEVHHGIRNILASFRRYQEDLATPQGSFVIDSPPENHAIRGLEVTPGLATSQTDGELGQISSASSAQLRLLQNSTYSDGSPGLQDEEALTAQHPESQMVIASSQSNSVELLSEMVLDFDYFPSDELFPADLNFDDYDRQFFDELEVENDPFLHDQENPNPSLPDMLALEYDGTSELFIEQNLKTKHHGNMLLPQP
ncbi:hypothetical protein BKA65DRAFT_61032 [Rhexocercosporidium sp. MPI-PUGE-AT-0058]|nr:hypothetical protein BKA65DRAFT_61032 [Rhexocercosporidium sp. MPI-PUGE-AT-0058]